MKNRKRRMNRKSLAAGVGALVLAGGGTLIATGQLSSASAAQPGTYTKSNEALGGNGGTEFDDLAELAKNAHQPLVRTLSVRGAERVDRVSLTLDIEVATFNSLPFDRAHGGGGGDPQSVSLSEAGRFIKSVAVGVAGGKVNSLKFTLSDDESLSVGGGTEPTQTFTAPDGQQVIGFFGRAGNSIDKLGVVFAPVICESAVNQEINKIPCS